MKFFKINCVKVLTFFVCFSSVSEVFAQSSQYVRSRHRGKTTIHLLIFINTADSELGEGNKKVLNYFQKTFEPKLRRNLHVEVNSQYYFDTRFNLSNMDAALRGLNASPSDVIFFYYSGHGYNNEGAYPTLTVGEQGVPVEPISKSLEKIYVELLSKKPRLLFVIGEACNEKPDVRHTIDKLNEYISFDSMEDDPEKFRKLFLESTGSCIMSSCSRGERSYQRRGQMGVFTNVFATLFAEYTRKKTNKKNIDWQHLLDEVCEETSKVFKDDSKGRKQNPQWNTGNYPEIRIDLEDLLNRADEAYQNNNLKKSLELYKYVANYENIDNWLKSRSLFGVEKVQNTKIRITGTVINEKLNPVKNATVSGGSNRYRFFDNTNYKGIYQIDIPYGQLVNDFLISCEHPKYLTAVGTVKENNYKLNFLLKKESNLFTYTCIAPELKIGFHFPTFKNSGVRPQNALLGYSVGLGVNFRQNQDYYEEYVVGLNVGLQFIYKDFRFGQKLNRPEKIVDRKSYMNIYSLALPVEMEVRLYEEIFFFQLGINNLLNLGGGIKDAEINYKEYNSLNNSLFNVYTPDISLGLQIRTEEKISLSLSYTHGLTNMLNKNYERVINGITTLPFEEVKLRNRGVVFNILYLF